MGGDIGPAPGDQFFPGGYAPQVQPVKAQSSQQQVHVAVGKAGKNAASRQVDDQGVRRAQGQCRFIRPHQGNAAGADGNGGSCPSGHGVNGSVIENGIHLSLLFPGAGSCAGMLSISSPMYTIRMTAAKRMIATWQMKPCGFLVRTGNVAVKPQPFFNGVLSLYGDNIPAVPFAGIGYRRADGYFRSGQNGENPQPLQGYFCGIGDNRNCCSHAVGKDGSFVPG